MATRKIRLITIFIVFVAILLFFISIALYPGGDIYGNQTAGFQFSKNYICNLFADTGLNGKYNQGKYFSLLGSTFLAIGFILTFILIPRYIGIGLNRSRWIFSLGFVSMIVACFISSTYHDSVINVSGTLGSIALFLILLELYKKGNHINFIICILGLICCVFTYFVYYFTTQFQLLASMQKISILLFILWLFHTHFSLYKS